ncbi:type IX secretion system membrane protein PorP/SprF, partial [Parapedobacter pyrenivorans]|uniref:type IX secretion system membrane protein PorP/SprF n=1 Tax=Parapedobacter pyrenivorans TaxID=1305674 RepID=UPI00166709C5
MKRNIISVIVILLAVGHIRAQQPLTHTQHGQLRTVINPAASLMSRKGEVSVIGRRQWVGMDGAPTVFWGSGHVGFESFGATAGLNIRHESLAVEKLTEASAFFAKSVRISETEYVGLSLNAGVSYLDGRFSQLDPLDPAFREDVKETDALVGFGVLLYRPERYYVGLSLPRLMLGSLGVASDSR